MLDIKKRENIVPTVEPEPISVVETIVEEEKLSVEKDEKENAKTGEIKKGRQKKIRRILMILFGTSVFFALTTAVLMYEVYALKKLASEEELRNPDVPVTPEQIMDAVAHHIFLPTGVPQIASVQDAQKLSTSQAFFKDAINGDVVLVYETMIILYRPTKDIIIAVGDISGVTK